MNKLLVTSLLLLFSVGAAAQESFMKSVEDGYELNAAHLRLPSAIGGNLDVKTCNTCPSSSYAVNAETRLFIGNSVVTLGEMRGFLDANPSAPVLVTTPRGKNVVLRIVAYGNLPR